MGARQVESKRRCAPIVKSTSEQQGHECAQHIYNKQCVARHAFDIANVVLNLSVLHQRSGAVVRVVVS